MGFILLLLLSLTTFVQVEVQSAETSQSRLKAEQNALLSMQIALGELQKTMGPDQRVSATAEILTTSDAEIKRGKRNSVGVWSSADVTTGGKAYQEGDLVAWLASDAKESNGDIDADYNESDGPSIGTTNTAVLVGPGSLLSAGGVVNDDKEQIVVGLTNTEIEESGSTTGRYGWWIGDEGMKARINLNRPEETVPYMTKYRAVLDAQATAVANASLYSGLSELDYNTQSNLANGISADTVINARNLELLPSSASATSANSPARQYFHDFTFHSLGVLADVKNGGLKKDLSLAFEMSDADFNASHFAGGNPQIAYEAYTNAGFDVSPVFSFKDEDYSSQGGASFDGFAVGPSWHLLRDYYRLYHKIETPMSNPIIDARVFGPNHRHQEHPLTTGILSEANANLQAAFMYAGGRANNIWSHGQHHSDQNDSPSDLMLKMEIYLGGPIFEPSHLGDPLRVGDNFETDSRIPTMVTGNYMPYMLKYVGQFGVYVFQQVRKIPSRMRSAFVIHNPYNVSLRHKDLSVAFTGMEVRVDLYEFGTGTRPAGLGEQNPVNTVHRALIQETGGSNNPLPLKPGEIKAFEGDTVKTNNYAQEITTLSENWNSVNNPDDNQYILGFTSTRPETQFTIVSRLGLKKGTKNNNQIIDRYIGSRHPAFEDAYSNIEFNHSLSMRQDDAPSSSPVNSGSWTDDIIRRWALAASASGVILGPGKDYESLTDDFRSTSEFRFPIDDPNFIGNTGDPAEWAYGYARTLDTTIHTNEQRTVILQSFAFQLTPAEYFTGNGLEARYPTYVQTNPLAPVKDSRGFLPAAEILKSNTIPGRGGLDGYPAFSPGWDLSIFEPKDLSGADVRLWGASDGSIDATSGGVSSAVMLEIPTAPPQSLGKLQHANISLYDHMPALAVGNSLASPYIAPDQVYAVNGNRYENDRMFYDLSYLMNDVLWDSYFFSSYSVPYDAGADDYPEKADGSNIVDSFDNAFVQADTPLPNPRMLLKLGDSETVQTVRNKMFNANGTLYFDSNQLKDSSYNRSAENLMVSGAFNVNSTSVEAWRAVLSGARDMAVYQSYDSASGGTPNNPASRAQDSTPFMRHSQPAGGEVLTPDIESSESWTGFRSLDDQQIEELATKIVEELKKRANAQGSRPFLTLSEFVNRKLSNDDYGLAGLLQAAINNSSLLGHESFGQTSEIPTSVLDGSSDSLGTAFPFPDNLENSANAAMGSPVYLLQADILQAIGSYISTRSDCFKIRSYGESVDPITGKVESKAWCEAIVQRVPELVEPEDGTTPDKHQYWSPTDSNGEYVSTPFGRKFKVISFRWISEDEV